MAAETRSQEGKLTVTATPYKPGYEGEHLSSTLTQPEKQALRLGKADLVRRLYEAMLTLSVMAGAGIRGIAAGGTPQHIVEFSDRVGEEKPNAPRLIFKPTAAQVTDLDPALALLEGLRPIYFKVVMLRAFHNFERRCGEPGSWSWKDIGGYFGMSDRWAEQTHDAAIVQAARRAGIIPKISTDYAVLAISVWVDRGWLTNISTAADPRLAVANLRGKSPVRLEDAYALWVAGKPVARRVAEDARRELRNLCSHGAWYKAHPDSVSQRLIEAARNADAGWILDEIAVRGALAA